MAGFLVSRRRIPEFLARGSCVTITDQALSRLTWMRKLAYNRDDRPIWRRGPAYMRILITGGAGFIGSHLADVLLERGDEVFILDDLSTGSIDNIRHLRSNPRFHYTIESVHRAAAVAELVDQCDAVFHLA